MAKRRMLAPVYKRKMWELLQISLLEELKQGALLHLVYLELEALHHEAFVELRRAQKDDKNPLAATEIHLYTQFLSMPPIKLIDQFCQTHNLRPRPEA